MKRIFKTRCIECNYLVVITTHDKEAAKEIKQQVKTDNYTCYKCKETRARVA